MATPRTFIVFDFETDGKNPELCNPVQIAALAVNSKTLKIVKGSEFNMMVKPPGIENLPEYLETVTGYKDSDTVEECIAWHAKTLKKTKEEVIESWANAPDQKFVWERFSQHINKFNWKGQMFSAPIACGMNIRDFDLTITNRLNNIHGIKTMFWLRDKVDLLDLFFYWLEDVEDAPKNYRMDTLREYFGMKERGSHDALVDVQDEAEIIIRFMKLLRKTSKNVKFKGAFK